MEIRKENKSVKTFFLYIVPALVRIANCTESLNLEVKFKSKFVCRNSVQYHLMVNPLTVNNTFL